MLCQIHHMCTVTAVDKLTMNIHLDHSIRMDFWCRLQKLSSHDCNTGHNGKCGDNDSNKKPS